MNSAPTINAIPTRYGNTLFRSRLEARWAIFFDALGVKWEYEPEGYTDGETMYLPDFWLPEFDCFWEVKPTDHYDAKKIEMLVENTGKRCYVSFGPPIHGDSETDDDSAHMFGPEEWDNCYRWCGCPYCGKLGLQFQEKGGRICRGHCSAWPAGVAAWQHEDSDGAYLKVRKAADIANAYQFSTATSPSPPKRRPSVVIR